MREEAGTQMRLVPQRSPQFRSDLIELYAFVHQRSPQGAERLIDAVERTVAMLCEHPGWGRAWKSPDPLLAGMRVMLAMPYRSYLVFYRPYATHIEFYRVVHGARDLDQVMDEFDMTFDAD